MSKPMTNYNERLDEILERYSLGADAYFDVSIRYGRTRNETKQALTSLIKELVAEARIDELTLLADFRMGDITVMGRNERSWRDRIAELKAKREEK